MRVGRAVGGLGIRLAGQVVGSMTCWIRMEMDDVVVEKNEDISFMSDLLDGGQT